ncbi:MAG: hypothetical protein KDD82_31220 [Planctomycetes bacterium]|nr:hypothetical protein [Planctomycetota bacterium]
MAIAAAFGQEPQPPEAPAQAKLGSTLRIEGRAYRVVELTKAGVWLEVQSVRGVARALLGGGTKGESKQRTFMPFAKDASAGPVVAQPPSRLEALEALCVEARALLARPDVSRKQVLGAFLEFEVELRALRGDPPADPAVRRELSVKLNEASKLVEEFKRVSYLRWSATIENTPARAMAELAAFRAHHAGADLQATGYAWVLLEEARRVWREQHVDPQLLGGTLTELIARQHELRKVRSIWRRVIGETPGHELRADLVALDATLILYGRRLDAEQEALGR